MNLDGQQITQHFPKIHLAVAYYSHSSVGKESACSAGDPSLIPASGRSPGEGTGYPPQYSWASLVAQLVKNLPAMQETGFNPWVGKIPWRRERLPTPVCWPGEFHGLYSPWGHKQSDTTERPSLHFTYNQHNDFSPHYGSHPQRIRAPFSKISAFATKINSECPLPS